MVKQLGQRMTDWVTRFDSPIGWLSVVVDGDGAVKLLHFGRLEQFGAREDAAAAAPVRAQLNEYFAGERKAFDL